MERIITPKAYPELKSKIKSISRDFAGEKLYILENGVMVTENEIVNK